MKPFISAFLLIILLAGCHPKEKQVNFHYAADTSFNSSCPYLTRDDEGKPVLSWVQQDAGGNTLVYFARYRDSTGQFGKPIAIPASSGVMTHGENLPKLIFTKDDKALLLFGVKNPQPDNPYTGAIRYSWSPDGGKHWQPAQPLVRDTMESYDQRYFDMALLPGGEIGMIWLSNSRPRGSTLYFSRADEEGRFSSKKILATHTCQCCRTALLIDDSGIIHVAWRNIFAGGVRDMAYCFSTDTGKTFSKPVRISADNWKINGCPHTGPAMVENEEGLHLSWFTLGGGGGIYYCHGKNQKGLFTSREVVSALPSARHPQMMVMDNGNIAIVWDEGVQNGDQQGRRIGLQLRGPSGKILTTSFLTGKTGYATFPQIELLNKKQAILAYTEGAQQQVRYKIVRL